MTNSHISLLSPQPLMEKSHRSLLLQFILHELLKAYRIYDGENWEKILSPHPRCFPYDWGCETGCLNRVNEHALLLRNSFAEVKSMERRFHKPLGHLKKKIPRELFASELIKLYSALEVLIQVCKDDENLIFFLLKNRETIDDLMGKGHLRNFLRKIHKEDLETLGEKLCDRYHRRGFFSQIPDFKILLTELTHA